MGLTQGFFLPVEVQGRLSRLGLEFLADFLARATERRPANAEALAELGNVLTELGRLEDGLAVDERLVRLLPDDPTVHYNLACSLALLGKSDRALDALERSFSLGYREVEHMQADEHLASLRTHPRYLALIARPSGTR